jgi:CheY-like chemotaxis protein
MSRAQQSLSLDGRAPAGPALDTQKLLGKRVLLAEDNLINQTVARKMLSSLGMQVEVAANGLEALNAVQRVGTAAAGLGDKMFALILMDMAMPVMGGVEATKAIRAAGFKLPIVAMTANASDSDKEECAAAGMDGFLSKPVLRDQLARAMLAVLEGQ